MRALVVEGGGLRGAYAVGALKILHENGGSEQFDTLYASSGSVFAATFFLAGQVKEMVGIWQNFVHGDQLIRYRNCLAGRPVLDLEHLIHLFQSPGSFLDLPRVLRARPRLYYVLTDYETGGPVYFDARRPDLFDLMRAAAALPCAYPRRVYVDGRRYFDGGASDPLPVRRALAQGHDEVLVIATRPHPTGEGAGDRPRRPPRADALATLCTCGSRRAKYALLTSDWRYHKALHVAQNPPHGVKVDVLRPVELEVGRLTRNQGRILHAIERGARDMASLIPRIHERRNAGST